MSDSIERFERIALDLAMFIAKNSNDVPAQRHVLLDLYAECKKAVAAPIQK